MAIVTLFPEGEQGEEETRYESRNNHVSTICSMDFRICRKRRVCVGGKMIKTLAVAMLLVPALGFAKMEIKPEGDCQANAGLACSQVVFKSKSSQHDQQIFCGDSYVYGDTTAKDFVKQHLAKGQSLILTNNGQYKDGYCSE